MFLDPLQWQDVSNFHSLTVRLQKSFKGVHAVTFYKVKFNSNGTTTYYSVQLVAATNTETKCIIL